MKRTTTRVVGLAVSTFLTAAILVCGGSPAGAEGVWPVAPGAQSGATTSATR